VLEFPTTVNFAYEIKSGDALSSIVPVWGNFLGVLIVPDRSSGCCEYKSPDDRLLFWNNELYSFKLIIGLIDWKH